MTILRAAVIGAGVGRAHMKGYRNSSDSELVAVCDANAVRLAEIAGEFGIPASQQYTDYHAMLETVKPDIVSIALPNYLHREFAVAALEAGAHVICEKPMATTVAEAEAMNAAAQKAGKQLAISYNYRYRADAQWIHKVIEGGGLGEIHLVNATWRRETGIPGSGWFGRKALSGGGPLIDLGVHVLDLSLWFMGFPQVRTVSSTTRSTFGPLGQKVWGQASWLGTKAEPFDVEDSAVGFLRFGNGASAILQATWAEHREPQADMIRIEVQGSKASIHMVVPNYRHDDTLRMYTEIEGEPVTIIPGLRNVKNVANHESLIAATLKALIAGEPVPNPGTEGIAAVRVLEAMYKSADAGHEISL